MPVMRPCYEFSVPNYSSSAPLQAADESLGRYFDFKQTTIGRASPLFTSAVESMEAALALLALGQVSQAYLLITQSLEVSLKGMIDEIMQLGLRAWIARNPTLARQRAASGSDFDEAELKGIVKDRTLIAAFRESSAFVKFPEPAKSSIYKINDWRNEIAHRGGEYQRHPHYFQSILSDLLPLLDEFYRQAMSLNICDLIHHDLARELIVAARFSRARQVGQKDLAAVLAMVRAAYFHKHDFAAGTPFEFSPRGERSDDWDYLRWEESLERRLVQSTRGILLNEIYLVCKICNQKCFVASDGVLKHEEGHPYLDATAVTCPYCHLAISEEYAELARLHFGPIDEKLCGAEDWKKLLADFDFLQ
jgi:hypothetical protein